MPPAPKTYSAASGRRSWWQYLYGPHIWISDVEADWSRGIVRDATRASIPRGGLYDSADYLLHQPGIAIKRGGTSYAGPAMTGATYAAQVAYADFPAGSKLVGIGDNGHLYTVTSGTTTDVSTMGTGFPGVDIPKLRIGGGKNLLVIPASDGTTAPKTYDGTTVATLGGSPAAGKYAAVYKTRVVLANTSANPNRIFFSPTPDPTTTWDTATSWIDADYPVTGLAALNNALLIFSSGRTERLVGSTPPPGSDMTRSPLGSIGCTDARSIAIQEGNAIFANPRGVYLTNGAGFKSLTAEAGIETYWQSLFSGYDPATWVISGGVYRSAFYVVSVLDNNGALKVTLMCNVARPAWWRLTNVKGMMWSPALGAADELYYADRATNRIVAISGMFSPAAGNKNDADGTAVTPLLEGRLRGEGIGLKAFGFGRLNYDMRDAATDAPTMAVSVATGVEATTFAAVSESPLAATTDETRKRFTVAKTSQGVTIRLQQTHASSKTEIYAVEVETRGFPITDSGQ